MWLAILSKESATNRQSSQTRPGSEWRHRTWRTWSSQDVDRTSSAPLPLQRPRSSPTAASPCPSRGTSPSTRSSAGTGSAAAASEEETPAATSGGARPTSSTADDSDAEHDDVDDELEHEDVDEQEHDDEVSEQHDVDEQEHDEEVSEQHDVAVLRGDGGAGAAYTATPSVDGGQNVSTECRAPASGFDT